MKLELQYTLCKGKLDPYFNNLAQGKAVSHVCPECKSQYFPPRLCCTDTYAFYPMTQKGMVLYRTQTADKVFALVQFDGCENSVIAQIINPENTHNICFLMKPPKDTVGIFVQIREK